jgi:hypothetical protein
MARSVMPSVTTLENNLILVTSIETRKQMLAGYTAGYTLQIECNMKEELLSGIIH